jgi:hypothetical protein
MQPKDHITTFYKKRFSPFTVTPEDILIEDIAHALSYMCRANGHFKQFYSIAQHSLNCAGEARARGYDKKTQLLLLLHDAAETYISDVTRPVKLHLPDYNALEERVRSAVNEKFGLPADELSQERESEIDFAFLCAEFKIFAGETVTENAQEIVSVPDFTERAFGEVKEEFLRVYYELI